MRKYIELTFCLLYDIHISLCHSAQDGNQVLCFYWIDPLQAIKQYIAKKQMLENSTLVFSLNFQTWIQPKVPFQEQIQDSLQTPTSYFWYCNNIFNYMQLYVMQPLHIIQIIEKI